MFNAIGRLSRPQVSGLGIFGDFVNLVGGIITDGVNFVIEGAHLVVSNGVRIALAPLMAIVAKVAGIAGTMAQITSAIRPWTVRLAAEPSQNRKAIGDEAPLTGDVTAQVDLGGLDEWPSFLVDCAQQAGVALPTLRPARNPVTWTLTTSAPDLANQDDADTSLDSASTATLRYRTGVDPEYDNPADAVGQLAVTAKVQRDDVTQLRDAFTNLVQEGLADLLPPIGDAVSPLVMPTIQPIIDASFDALAHLRDVTGTITIPVSYHTPGDDDTGPTTPTGPGNRGLPTDCPSATPLSAATGLPLQGPEAGTPPPDLPTGLTCGYAFQEGTAIGFLGIGYHPPTDRGLEDLIARNEDHLAANGLPTPSNCEPTQIADARAACIQVTSLAAYLYIETDDVMVAISASGTPPAPQDIVANATDVALQATA